LTARNITRAERQRLASAKAQVEKLCVTIDKTAGAMRPAPALCNALYTAHLVKGPGDACRALREHEMPPCASRRRAGGACAPTYWPMPD
jgi:glutamine synthetase